MGRAMAEASPAAREVFAIADRVLGFSLSTLCFEGPDEELVQTINAQPALLAGGIACLAALREHVDVRPAFVAGHSLGEYTALVATGALGLEDGLRIVRERGRLMQEAGDERPGTMAAVLGVDDAVLEEICAGVTDGLVCIGNYNAPGQATLSGDLGAVRAAGEAARQRGARRVLPLNVSGAFHSPLMAPAAERLDALLATLDVAAPSCPLVANVTAEVLATPEAIRAELSQQIRRPVRWSQSVERMIAEGVDRFLELGPRQVLSGLIRRINRSARTLALGEPEGLAQAVRFVRAEASV